MKGTLKTVAIIQARMGSSRLPNKMMLHLHGYPVCEWVFRRVQQANCIDQVVFALPNNKNDDVLAFYLQSIGANVFRGSEPDLIERFYLSAKQFSADNIIRVCADNPLICASEIDRLVCFFENESCDYAYNHIPKNNTYPDGIGAEICNIDLLEYLYKQTKSLNHREHLFNYVWENSDKFNIRTFDSPDDLAFPDLKLDLDTYDDYKSLLDLPYKITMSASDVVKLASSNLKNSNR